MMTVTDFLDWPGDGLGTRYELIDGVLRAMAPASVTHGTIQVNLTYLVSGHLRATKSACRLVANPGVQPRTRSEWNFRVPDLGVTCRSTGSGDIMIPDPILLIEVLSPGNANDTYESLRAYATLPSVQEIAVVHSTRRRIELLRRDGNGHWPADPALIEAGGLTFTSIGADLPLAEIYAGTHLTAAS